MDSEPASPWPQQQIHPMAKQVRLLNFTRSLKERELALKAKDRAHGPWIMGPLALGHGHEPWAQGSWAQVQGPWAQAQGS